MKARCVRIGDPGDPLFTVQLEFTVLAAGILYASLGCPLAAFMARELSGCPGVIPPECIAGLLAQCWDPRRASDPCLHMPGRCWHSTDVAACPAVASESGMHFSLVTAVGAVCCILPEGLWCLQLTQLARRLSSGVAHLARCVKTSLSPSLIV